MRRITGMETEYSSMLALLHSHANEHAERLAHVLPDRDITYRRLWSRIERGSARLQGEWGVRPGDLVAYVGRGHPDAIVLYFSLLRIGASLLPLEGLSAAEVSRAMNTLGVTLAVHDEGLAVDGLPARRLEDLLAIWSHVDPVLASDEMTVRALWLPEAGSQWRATSLLELCAALPPVPRSTFIDDRIFTDELMTQVVLPSLRDVCLMQFAASDPVRRTGS